jgi:hypothetical protein
MVSRGFEVDENHVRSDSLYNISGSIYENLGYYHDIRGIQEICERKEMKRCVAKYLEVTGRLTHRPRRIQKKKAVKNLLF